MLSTAVIYGLRTATEKAGRSTASGAGHRSARCFLTVTATRQASDGQGLFGPYFNGGAERWITDFRAKLEWMRATPGIRVRNPVMKAW